MDNEIRNGVQKILEMETDRLAHCLDVPFELAELVKIQMRSVGPKTIQTLQESYEGRAA